MTMYPQTLTVKVHTEQDKEVDMLVMGTTYGMGILVPVMVANPDERDTSRLRVKWAPPGTPTDQIIGYVARKDINTEEATG